MGHQDQPGLLTVRSQLPCRVTPEQIVEGAENCLRHNAYLSSQNLRCECQEGVLTLRGCLPSYYLRQLAQAVVERLEGVKRIVNEIDVVAGRPR